MRAAAGVLAFLLTLALSAAAAGAPKGPGPTPPCPKATLCLWKGDNFTGERLKVDEPGLSNLPDWMNNEASSFRNRRSKVVVLYAGRNGNGDALCYSPQWTNSSLGFDS